MYRFVMLTCLSSVIFVATGNPVSHADIVAYRNAVLADNPYAFYRLGESSGPTAFDESTNNRNATYHNGPTLGVPGFRGDTAVRFDGSDDFVRAPLENFGTNLDSFSVEAIFKTTTTQFGSVVASFNSTVPNSGFSMRVNSSSLGGSGQVGGTGFFVRDNSVRAISGNFTTDIYDGKWHHVVMTYDRTGATPSDRLKAYVDGQQQALSYFFNQAPSNFLALDQPVGIGATQATLPNTQDFFDGSIDAVAFFDQALTASQVAAHYSAAAIPEPNLAVASGVAFLFLLARSRRRRNR